MGGQKEFETKCFINYLLSLKLIEDRSRGSHHIYKKPGLKRSIVVRANDKTIPEFHVSTNLKSLLKTKHDFIAWMKENC